jgi:hypothetical protein
MKPFNNDGAGSLDIYWEQDWDYVAGNPGGKSYACKLVGYQTPFSAFKEGDYTQCVQHYFKVVAKVTEEIGSNVPNSNDDSSNTRIRLNIPAQASIDETVTLTVTDSLASSDDGITSVLFYEGLTLIGDDITAPYTTEYAPNTLGTFTINVIVNYEMSDKESISVQLRVIDPDIAIPQGSEYLTLSNLPLQINVNEATEKFFIFDERIQKIASRKNGKQASWTVDGQKLTVKGIASGRTGLKIMTESGQNYYMGLRINHQDGTLPGLPKYLSIGSVSEDNPDDLEFWRDIDTDATNKEMDIRYIYINGGPSGDNFWQGWQSWSESRAGKYAKESLRFGLIPFYVYYNLPDGGESFTRNLEHVRDPLYMSDYFQDLNFFMDEVQDELDGELYGIILEPDFLGYFQQNGVLHLGTNKPDEISTVVGADVIGQEAGNIRTLIERINKTINDKRLEGHTIFYGWQLNLWSYAPTSGAKGVLRRTDEDDLGWEAGRAAIDEAARETTQYGMDAGILTYGADFVSIDKYGLDAMIHQNRENPSDSTWFWTNDHWQNYLRFVSVMKETADKPIVLWQLPIGHINGSETTSAYTGGAFPLLDNSDTKGEDSTTSYFFGDTFTPNDSVRLDYFSQNKANDPKLSVEGNQITWGDHIQEAKDAGVIVALFGAGVGASTDGVGAPATDDYFWIQKVQGYYENGPIPLEKEYGLDGFVCGESCGPWLGFTELTDKQEFRQDVLSTISIAVDSRDVDGQVESVSASIDGQVLTLVRVVGSSTYATNWLPSKYGNFELTVTSIDNEGLSNNKRLTLSVISSDTCTLPAWDASVVYEINNTRVEYQGLAYENKYYIAGEAPNPDAEEYGVWTKLGDCLDL